MAVTEKQRHDLLRKFEEDWGPQYAETIMELLPPAGWADVATRQHVDASAVLLRAELAQVSAEQRAEMAELGSELRAEMAQLRLDMTTGFQQVRLEIAALEASLQRRFTTGLIALMGIQTAVIGLLVSLA